LGNGSAQSRAREASRTASPSSVKRSALVERFCAHLSPQIGSALLTHLKMQPVGLRQDEAASDYRKLKRWQEITLQL
jgi:hypothetical protein